MMTTIGQSTWIRVPARTADDPWTQLELLPDECSDWKRRGSLRRAGVVNGRARAGAGGES